MHKEAVTMSSQPIATPPDSPSDTDIERHQDDDQSARRGETEEKGDYAEGSTTAWLQVAMGWLVIFTTWGYINSFGAFQAYYNETMPESPSAISWIGSVQAWLTFVVGSFSGKLLDAGYFRSAVWVGCTLQLLGIFLMSTSTKYWALLLTQGILTGIGGGLLFTPTVALVSTYFSRRRAVAIGIMTTGNSTGGIVYPIVVRQLLPAVGFAWTSRVLGFINLALFAFVVLLMKPKPASGRLTLRTLFAFEALKEPVFLSVVGGIFFSLWGIFSVFYFIAPYGRDVLHMSYADASLLVTLVNGAGLPARAVVPLLADRAGTLNVVGPVVASVSVVTFCWLVASDRVGIFVFAAFYGLASGAFQALMPTTVASITKDMRTVGSRIGMAFAVISFASLTGPPIGGALLFDEGTDFTWLQVWVGLASVASAALLILARILLVGLKLSVKC